MTTALLTHSDGLKHLMPQGHPEQVARLEYVLVALDAPEFADLMRVSAPLAEDAHILRAHPSTYLETIKAKAPETGSIPLDPDTHMSPGTLNAALRAAGGNVMAVDLVMSGKVGNAFIAMRPPGHHAETAKPMGFCLFGSVVIGARHAIEAHGLQRVAIVDFDVHHGNGTQDLVWDDPQILFASTHQMPLFPGTGAAHETGAHGQVINVPLAPGTGGKEFRRAMEAQILPAIDRFEPDLIMISAGFDAHEADPLANLNFTEADFDWATHQICDLADKHAMGRVVSTLEGGYDLQALAESTAAHVKVLMERAQ